MSLLTAKRSVKQLKCEVVGHEISLEAEEKLYTVPDRKIETACERCGASLFLEMDETNEDKYFETEL